MHDLLNHKTVRVLLTLTCVGLIAIAATPTPVLAQGPVIDVWYGLDQRVGHIGIAQPWYNILGNVSDVDGIASLVYSLNGAPDVTLTVGGDGRRLASSGDFNVDLAIADLVVGANQVVITAVDNDVPSNQTQVTVTVTYTSGNAWPLPYTVDWTALAEIEDAALVVDGLWSMIPGGTVRTTIPGYDRLIAIGGQPWTDYEVTVPITFHTQPSSFGTGILFRWNGHTDNPIAGTQPKSGYLPLGCITWYRANRLELYGNNADILGTASRTLAIGVPYMFKARVETIPGIGGQYSMKVWEVGQPEPPAWDVVGQDQLTDPQNGSLMLISHRADVSYGEVNVVAIPVTIGNISVGVTGGGTGATVNWTTNVPASSSVAYGLTPSYEIGTVSDPTLVTNHSLALTGLTPDALHHYEITSVDAGSNSASTGDRTFTASLAGLVSDDFSSPILNTGLWTFVDPLTDGSYTLTGSGTNDAWLNLSVPAGTEHQVWTNGIEVPHMVQSANDADFEVEVKFESPLNQQFQEQGVLVKQDSGDYMRFEFFSNSTSTVLFVASFVAQTPTTQLNAVIDNTGVAPLYMRVGRQGNQWTVTYSYDGTTWLNGTVFTHAINVAEVGVYAGNGLAAGSPAHTAAIDYFFDTSSPIVPEDPLAPWGISNVQVTATDNSATITWDTGVPATSSVAYGLTPTYEIGTESDPTLVTSHSVTLTGLAPLTVHHYEITSTDAAMVSVSSGDATFVTTGDASGIVSDDFNRTILETSIWTWVDPLNDGTVTTTGFLTDDAWANISVPAGVEHQVYTGGIEAPHLLQSANNTDFEVEAKFESAVTLQYQEQGILVKQDDDNYMRFEFFSTTTSTVLYARVFTATTSPTYVNTTIATNGVAPLYMRVGRVGDLWTLSHSFDGTNWTAQPAFTHVISVTGIGPYGGNAVGATSPAFTTSIDYFFNTASPVDPEDGEGIIPVFLQSFDAERNGNRAVLRWLIAGASEDHVGFDVYRVKSNDLRERINMAPLSGRLSYEFVDEAAPRAETQYWLREITQDGDAAWYGPAVLAAAVQQPRFALAPNYPNPFNPTTSIRFEIDRRGAVSLRIYDPQGRLVRTLLDETRDAGPHATTWDGRDANGVAVSSGVYFVQLVSGNNVQSRKIVLLK